MVKNVVCLTVNSTKCICTGKLKTEQINYEEERKKGEKRYWALLELQMLIHKINLEITRHVLPENIFKPHPPPKEGLWLEPPPFLQPTLFSSYSSYVLLKILALKELNNEIDQKIKQRDIKITTQKYEKKV